MKYLQPLRSGARSNRPSASGRVLSDWRTWLTGTLLFCSALSFVLSTPVAAEERGSHPRKNTFMKREWGIEIMYVRQSAAGYMLEFRYKVLDAEKAEALFNRKTKPVLIHEKTGAQLIVPTPAKTGALRNSNIPLDDHIYWMFFANPGRLVEPGELVDIQIGEFLVENLVVQ